MRALGSLAHRRDPSTMNFSMEPPRLLQTLPGALVNGAINGAIAWSAFKGSDRVPLSVDSIAAPG